MGLETGTYPADLIVTNPAAGDPVSQGDDHLRLVKTVVKNAAAGPAFSAYQSVSQSINSATLTKVSLQTEEFDTANCFDTATYRFTPNVAGYYDVKGAAHIATTEADLLLTIYKNGSEFKRGVQGSIAGPLFGASASALISMNGTTDYVELYVLHNSGSAKSLDASAALTYFQAHLARLA